MNLLKNQSKCISKAWNDTMPTSSPSSARNTTKKNQKQEKMRANSLKKRLISINQSNNLSIKRFRLKIVFINHECMCFCVCSLFRCVSPVRSTQDHTYRSVCYLSIYVFKYMNFIYILFVCYVKLSTNCFFFKRKYKNKYRCTTVETVSQPGNKMNIIVHKIKCTLEFEE